MEICARITDRLTDIADKSTQLDTLVAEVARASQEQSQGISQLGTAVVQMDKVTQSNAATAEESASAATELHHQAVVLQEAVRELLENIVGASNGEKVAAGTRANAPGTKGTSVPPDGSQISGRRWVKTASAPKTATNTPARNRQTAHGKFLGN